MTGRHVSLQCGYWADPDLAGWSPLGRLLYLWLWTCEHVNGVTGVGEAAPAVITSQTGMTVADIEYAKGDIGERVRWFGPGRWWVKARARHTCYTHAGGLNPKLALCARRQAAAMRPEIRAEFLAEYPDLAPGECLPEPPAAGASEDALAAGGSGEARPPAESRPAAREWDGWEVAAVVAGEGIQTTYQVGSKTYPTTTRTGGTWSVSFELFLAD